MIKPYTLFIADIHLQPDPSHPINQAFEKFLQNEAPQADALYILGDLFEMWVGDDIGLEQYARVIQQFKQLTDQGLPIYLLYGNRDFLMRDRFWQATVIQPLSDIECITLYDKSDLILHGDTLCKNDKSYQKMRPL
ncbi:MAG: UDP-2,3-diacylglucosamine diphosphatase, partial [Thiomicrorhabdus sp.]|nr:UDP-2,3-diacylglucosamine diphosphatase [Thiomicrorhabdus sp.]